MPWSHTTQKGCSNAGTEVSSQYYGSDLWAQLLRSWTMSEPRRWNGDTSIKSWTPSSAVQPRRNFRRTRAVLSSLPPRPCCWHGGRKQGSTYVYVWCLRCEPAQEQVNIHRAHFLAVICYFKEETSLIYDTSPPPWGFGATSNLLSNRKESTTGIRVLHRTELLGLKFAPPTCSQRRNELAGGSRTGLGDQRNRCNLNSRFPFYALSAYSSQFPLSQSSWIRTGTLSTIWSLERERRSFTEKYSSPY